MRFKWCSYQSFEIHDLCGCVVGGHLGNFIAFSIYLYHKKGSGLSRYILELLKTHQGIHFLPRGLIMKLSKFKIQTINRFIDFDQKTIPFFLSSGAWKLNTVISSWDYSRSGVVQRTNDLPHLWLQLYTYPRGFVPTFLIVFLVKRRPARTDVEHQPTKPLWWKRRVYPKAERGQARFVSFLSVHIRYIIKPFSA